MSEFSIVGLAHKFLLAAEEQGYTPAMINELAENKELLKNFFEVQSGRFEIKPKEHTWHEQDGLIRFSVISDGTTGPEWIKRLEKKGFRIGDYAKSILKSKDFKPTSGIATEIVVLPGKLFSDSDRITKNIRAEAERRSFGTPNAEIACLVREKFSDEDLEAMDLAWIVAMHDPIKDSVGDPSLLGADRDDDGSWLSARWGHPGRRWYGGGGFAFALSQS